MKRSRKRRGRLKAKGIKKGRYERSGECDTERRLKGENELSGICHDFTHLCGDKVMNVNDRHLLDVQNASPM